MLEILGLRIALFFALILSGIFYVPYKNCADSCEQHKMNCYIQEHNATRTIPMDGEKINANGIYTTTYWSIRPLRLFNTNYSIYSWDNKRPTEGTHDCCYGIRGYISLNTCKAHCKPQFFQ